MAKLLGDHSSQNFQITAKDILFEDEHLIAVNKPPFLPTQPTVDDARVNIYGALKKYLNSYVGLHHRLDRDTSGVILFSKTKEINYLAFSLEVRRRCGRPSPREEEGRRFHLP